MSSCCVAIRAATRQVMPPTQAMTSRAAGTCSSTGKKRASMYTPAATIVAAWSSAETGVGPSIEFGSQTWSGSWADLPTVPQKMSTQAMVR